MIWKSYLLTAGAAGTAGLVLAGNVRRRLVERRRLRRAALASGVARVEAEQLTLDIEIELEPGVMRQGPEEVRSQEARVNQGSAAPRARREEAPGPEASSESTEAREDALRALRAVGDGIDLEFDLDTRRDPADVDVMEGEDVVHELERPEEAEEPYDALEPEDYGKEWLIRATEGPPLEGPSPREVLEGTPEPEPVASTDDLAGEKAYGRDQAGAPLAPNAGTKDYDVAAELPVGTLDRAGNVELHEPLAPPDAFDAPPTSELSPNAEELEQRSKAGGRRPRR